MGRVGIVGRGWLGLVLLDRLSIAFVQSLGLRGARAQSARVTTCLLIHRRSRGPPHRGPWEMVYLNLGTEGVKPGDGARRPTVSVVYLPPIP